MEFILDNWYILLIVLISFLFQRMGRSKNEEREKPSSRQPTIVQSSPEPSIPRVDSTDSISTFYDSTTYPSFQTDGLSDGGATPSASNRNRLAATQNEAVQGMMWAEIFGKPRSLNPHPIRNKYRR
jgi:hypothetical protein